jgi:HAD superfamily hydrolase (TIGR01549 family)
LRNFPTTFKRRSLRDTFASTSCVLFDFDGPICAVYAGVPAHEVADRLRDVLAAWGLEAPGPARDTKDPLKVLAEVDAALLGSPRHYKVAELEEELTRQEVRAVGLAAPTAGAEDVIRLMAAQERRIAVVTNNSPDAAERYLTAQGLAGLFGKHIHGRTSDPTLMKPDPSCLLRALDSTGSDAQDAVMVGDSAFDVGAARNADVRFVGLARDERKADELRTAGARHLVSSMSELYRLAQ